MVILIEISRTATIILLYQLEVLIFISICLSSSSVVPQTSTTSIVTNKQDGPFWKRPGCHRVGHTRTIAIPGCVKFDLTTNACRGYCLSYSIPSIEDIGPPLSDSGGMVVPSQASTNTNNAGLHGVAIGDSIGGDSSSLVKGNQSNNNVSSDTPKAQINPEHLESILSTLSTTHVPDTNNQSNSSGTKIFNGMLSEQLNQLISKQQQQYQDQDQDQDRQMRKSLPNLSYGADTRNDNEKSSSLLMPGLSADEQAMINPDLITSTGPIEANLVPSGPKQDIISIGQCCSMIETEYIKVNVRCENGIRDFVFKSAKSCECFFCKKM